MGAQISELDQRRQKENMVIWMAGWIQNLMCQRNVARRCMKNIFEIQYVYHFVVVWEVLISNIVFWWTSHDCLVVLPLHLVLTWICNCWLSKCHGNGFSRPPLYERFSNLIIVHARVLVFWIWIAGLQLGSVFFVGGLLKGCKSSRIKLGPWIDVYILFQLLCIGKCVHSATLAKPAQRVPQQINATEGVCTVDWVCATRHQWYP